MSTTSHIKRVLIEKEQKFLKHRWRLNREKIMLEGTEETKTYVMGINISQKEMQIEVKAEKMGLQI